MKFVWVGDSLREVAKENTKEIVLGFLDGMRDIIVEFAGSFTLIGCTLLIILKIAGYDKGYKQAAIIFVANALIKLLLGW